MGESVWTVFCNNSKCAEEAGRTCSSGFSAIFSPSSCVNHAFVICVDILLLSISLFITIYKLTRKKSGATSQSHCFSSLLLFSAILNGILGAAYFGWGIWVIIQKLSADHTILPLNGWLVACFQGFTWFLMSLFISLNMINLPPIRTVKICSTLAFLYAGFLCISSLQEAATDRTISVKIILDILSFPGSLSLLFCAFKQHDSVDTYPVNADACYTPLQGKDPDATGQIASCPVTPFAKAGFFSKMSFWWLNPLMKKGREKILEQQDIPKLREADRAQTCYLMYVEQLRKHKQKERTDPPSLFSILLSMYWEAIFVTGFFALVKVLSLSTGPLFLRAFIRVAEGKEAFKYESYLLTVGLFVAKCLESLSERQWFFRTRLAGLQVRSLLSAAIYQKQLRLSNSAKMTHSPGDIVNYVSLDAYRIGEFPYWFHQIWATSLQLCLALFIVYYSVGLASVAALIAIVLTVAAYSPLVKLQHEYQKKLMVAQGKRLKAITETLANMKVLKLYAWETHFKNVIEGLRKEEFKWISGLMAQKGFNLVLFWSSPTIVPIVTFWTCYFLGIPLDAANAFTFLSCLRIVQEPIRLIPDVLGVFIEAKVSLDRIVRFLQEQELTNRNLQQKCNDIVFEHSVFIRCTEISWDTNPSSRATLRNINLTIKPGEKVAICGEVGSGKSTLLATVLGEVPKINGIVDYHGKIAYVSQTAWIQTGSIQENILFGSVMDPVRYAAVLQKSCLVKDLEILPYGDLAEIGERGVNLSGGQKQRVQLARALYQDADIYLLDDPFSAVDAHTATRLFNDYIMGALSGKTVLLVTHQVDFLPAFTSILLMSGGEIIRDNTYDELLASSQEFQDLVNAHNNTTETEIQARTSCGRLPIQSTGEIQSEYVKEKSGVPSGEQLIKQEEREIGHTGLKPYLQYLSHNKGFLYFSLASIIHMMFIIGQFIQNFWLAADIQNSTVNRVKLIAVYTLIGCGLAILLFLRSFSLVVLSCRASESIFSTLLKSLFRASMSFYDSTPLGRILSRVSSDLSIIDLEIAIKSVIAVGSTMNAYFMLAVLGILAWPVVFVIIPTVYLSILIQKYYFASSKELMRTNGTTKSVEASYLAESIAGAMTIRAFGEQERFFKKNLDIIDANASPYFHSFSADEWLIQRLEMLCAVVLTSSALALTLIPFGASSSGLIGMALSYGLSLNVFLVGSIQYQCLLENMVISVERLEQYMHIPCEAPEVNDDKRPAEDWPSVGKVEIYNLKVRYRPSSPLVLQGINCIIEGGSKVGIVGRTGSGKTTLIGALFRLVEPTHGKIVIDGLNISQIGLHDLRSRLGVIPQDPTLFDGSVRYNLDPLSQHNDNEIWKVLEKCQLREAVEEKEEGLDSIVVQDGSNWSMGQRQLFCLGRALLKKSRILVLDEATASIDNATDSILQKTIRTEFTECTVITVAHRIPTVMDCTMVLGISDGMVMEYDEPFTLMKKEGSLFGQLVKEYWSRCANSAEIDDQELQF
ncbi:hypothetical protein SLA2020_496930 [Shorea laevis]